MLRPLVLIFLFGLSSALAWPADPATTWTSLTWNGEPAWASSSLGWRAIVSVSRGRLMHFGPDGTDINLLLAPETRANPNRLGGHRLWLGPQSSWVSFWPPPAAWEYREPATVVQATGILRLTMPPTNDGWPQLTRTYHWNGASLVCGAEFSGGTRPAQFVQILQVPPSVRVTVEPRPERAFPAGYVRLGPFAARFDEPPQVTRTNNSLVLHHNGAVMKLGFRPQTLVGRISGFDLRVGRGASTGTTVGDPDEGFHTQVYLSEGHEAFAELEQLSPLFAPGQHARFEIVLTGTAQ
jgi:hypothetical protein